MSEVQNGVPWLKINMSAGLLEALGGDSIPLPLPASRGHPLFLTCGPFTIFKFGSIKSLESFWHSHLCVCSHISSQSGHESLGTRGQTVPHPKMSTSQSPEPEFVTLHGRGVLYMWVCEGPFFFLIICLAASGLSCGKQHLHCIIFCCGTLTL